MKDFLKFDEVVGKSVVAVYRFSVPPCKGIKFIKLNVGYLYICFEMSGLTVALLT